MKFYHKFSANFIIFSVKNLGIKKINNEFLEILSQTFCKYLAIVAKSNEKLKILHTKITMDLKQKFAQEYEVYALSVNKKVAKRAIL